MFNVATYNYYCGSVFSAYHAGPVSPSKHHYRLSDGALLPDGSVRFHIYLDGGTPDTASHIVEVSVVDQDGAILQH